MSVVLYQHKGNNGAQFDKCLLQGCPKYALTLMLLVANLAITKSCKNHEKLMKPWQMGTHLRELSKSFPMNTNMTGFNGFQKALRPCALDLKVAPALEGLFDLLQY